jgi:hypothetical protein
MLMIKLLICTWIRFLLVELGVCKQIRNQSPHMMSDAAQPPKRERNLPDRLSTDCHWLLIDGLGPRLARRYSMQKDDRILSAPQAVVRKGILNVCTCKTIQRRSQRYGSEGKATRDEQAIREFRSPIVLCTGWR